MHALGAQYLARTRVQRQTARPLFIDKMPNNWQHVALIHLTLPNARIIDARRHPLGCCFSNFKQHFARGQGFSYDLATMGRYYADYVRLMDHIDTVLPG
ncbi:sulfotransferase, partial [Shewanella algae]|uniref:sulfotransferase family protein n=1 Tax=Shewanella algae TaxID=38313 RepID=UPI00313A8518